MICNVYHSPNKSDGEFTESIEEEYEKMIDKKHIIIIIRDFNIDISRENQYKHLIQNLRYLGLKQYVNEYTRIIETSKTQIDLVFSNFYVYDRGPNDAKNHRPSSS